LAAGLVAVFLAAGIVFALLVDFEGAIFNACYTLYPRDLFKSQTVESAHQNKTEVKLVTHGVQQTQNESWNLHAPIWIYIKVISLTLDRS
jgi:hypothetical protein